MRHLISTTSLIGLSLLACACSGTRQAPASTSAAQTSSATVDGPLAKEALPTEIIPLSSAKECVTTHRFDEWAQLPLLFRLKGEALAVWDARAKKAIAMKTETKDGAKARTWLLSGLSSQQQQYWAQWSFYRGFVGRLDTKKADAKLQQSIWDLAAPYAARQIEKNYVQVDPYLKNAKDDFSRYGAEVDAKLPK
jgi:hypothetical protein